MYIGDPDERGLHHCVFEVLDNSIDEHLAGYCDEIEVTVHVDGSVSIRDNGRGIPVDMHPKWKMPAVELVLTNLHAGGKFGQGAYKIFRRHARRRRQMRERAFGLVQSGSFARWQSVSHGVRARKDDGEIEGDRQIQGHRHADHVQAGSRRFSRSRPSSNSKSWPIVCANWRF